MLTIGHAAAASALAAARQQDTPLKLNDLEIELFVLATTSAPARPNAIKAAEAIRTAREQMMTDADQAYDRATLDAGFGLAAAALAEAAPEAQRLDGYEGCDGRPF